MQIKCDRINGGISTYGRDLSKALSWFCQMDGDFYKAVHLPDGEVDKQIGIADVPDTMTFTIR